MMVIYVIRGQRVLFLLLCDVILCVINRWKQKAESLNTLNHYYYYQNRKVSSEGDLYCKE